MRFSTMAVAIDQHHGFKPISRCKLQSYGHIDQKLLELDQTSHNHSSKQSIESNNNFPRSFSTPCLPLTPSAGEELASYPKIEIVGGSGAPLVHALVVEVAIAMASGSHPIPVSKGLGGAYVFRSQNGKDIAVAKPADEEPLAFNNPKGLRGRLFGQPGLKHSIRVGETGIRELAACFLDHASFAGVPPTALVKFSHAAFYFTDAAAAVPSAIPCKIASLQRFVDHDFDAAELGPSFFSVASVHKIGILDIRLLNLDRHAGNMLVKKKQGHHSYNACGVAELVPIDHGLCLPEWLDDPYFEWLHWPQASVAFSESELDYISKLDPFKDAELLRTKLPSLRECAIRVLVVCTIFLKQAAAAGICIGDIGQMMTRQFCGGEEMPSKLEDICSRAKAIIRRGSNVEKMKEETEQGSNMFQPDNPTLNGLNKGLGMPGFPLAGSLAGSCEEADNRNKTLDAGKIDDGESETKGVLTKSVSMSSWNQNCETGVISFGEMNQGEWGMFLETFEQLLLGVFDDNKCGN
ncbi:phosphatidylinositol 4-kinase gamma 1 [Neltuma alba]|uniref:phosphatidylinositol 4-kinase gamma 1 n=1 Tax=Neltuma alba TaxID=207710 RepID=UPI0010A33D2C|nr:phosphatidylinositol 4-kinase gamma 1 [Prosopis alba]